MAMKDNALLGPWVRKFLLENLLLERNLSQNTRASYRDALVLLLPFIGSARKKPVDSLAVDDMSASIVKRFLGHLENERHCSVATRNQRLVAIHSLAKYIGKKSPEHASWCKDIRDIPLKVAPKPTIPRFAKQEIEAVLLAPDQQTTLGARDYALLLFLYNTGARVDEAVRLVADDITLGNYSSVRLLGKGGKIRYCPLWPKTAEVLKALIGNRGKQEHVFLNRLGEPLTRFGIYGLVRRVAGKAANTVPSINKKRMSPHCIRHTTACDLLKAGVDINTIRAWLGHVSLSTTNIYAQVDLDMEAEALAKLDIPGATSRGTRRWHKEQGVMEFLRGLRAAAQR
jgi:integrase/recombinase XerD